MDDVFEDDREKQTCTLNEYLDDLEEREMVYFLAIIKVIVTFPILSRVLEFNFCRLFLNCLSEP